MATEAVAVGATIAAINASGDAIRDEIDALVSAWRRDGGILARRATLVERFKQWAVQRALDKRVEASDEIMRHIHATQMAERRRCSAIVTQVAREIDAETAAKLDALAPGEEADNAAAVGAVRAARMMWLRINGKTEEDVESLVRGDKADPVESCGIIGHHAYCECHISTEAVATP